MTQEPAAELLGMSVRSFQRWRERYETDGEAGLVDRRGGPSPRRPPEEEVERMLGLYRDKYADFTVKHFHDHLTKRHNYTLGYTVTKLRLHRARLVRLASKRSAHRRSGRAGRCADVLHQDGSRHVWVEGRPSIDLIVTMDDATSDIYSMILVEEEGTASTFEALREIVGERGLCLTRSTPTAAAMFTRLPVRICGQVEMQIHHALLGKCPRTEVEEVYSRRRSSASAATGWPSTCRPRGRSR